jgi:hypothetical protein
VFKFGMQGLSFTHTPFLIWDIPELEEVEEEERKKLSPRQSHMHEGGMQTPTLTVFPSYSAECFLLQFFCSIVSILHFSFIYRLFYSRDQFHQCSTSSFYVLRSQKRKKDSQVVNLFCAFGICACKSCS